jgi:hypothetical protein
LDANLDNFAHQTGGEPYWRWNWPGVNLTNIPATNPLLFPAAFAEATANAEWIYFDVSPPFDGWQALASPDGWFDGNFTNMEYKIIAFDPVLSAKTTFVP